MSEQWSKPVADRLKRLPPYLFGRINAMKYRKRREGVDIIDLGMGNPSDPTPEVIVRKLQECSSDPRNQRYSASAGIFNLKREVARMYRRVHDVELDPENEVIATIGSKEGFSHLCLALMGPGDTAIVGDPYFPIHVYSVALAGANVINVTLGNDHGFLSRVAGVIENMYPRPKVLVLNYPHNPTAMTVDSPAFFDEVVRMAAKEGVMVIHDFAYGRTCFDSYRAPSFMQARGARDVGVEFITLSKPFNMAGWRVGFCVGNAEMIRALATIKGYYDYGIFQAVQIAGIIALRECDREVVSQAELYRERRDVLVEGLRKMGWSVESPRASMFVWARVAEEHLRGRGTIDFSLRMLDEAEVALAPGRAFGLNGEGYVRIALVENRQRLQQAVRNLDRALNKGIIAPSATKLKTRSGAGQAVDTPSPEEQ